MSDDISLKHDGKTLAFEMRIAFPFSAPKDDIVQAGFDAAKSIDRIAKGPDESTVLGMMSLKDTGGCVILQFMYMVNTPEDQQTLIDRFAPFLAEGKYAVVYFIVSDLDLEDPAQDWEKMRKLAKESENAIRAD